MSSRNSKIRLKDILRAIENIYDIRTLLIKYQYDEILPAVAYNATYYSLIVIGEAANRLDRGYRANHPNIDWRLLVELRNKLTHQYYEIEVDYIDELIEAYLSKIHEQIKILLETQA